MKKVGFAAAAMMMLAGIAPASIAAPAAAQRTVVHERTVVRHGPAHHDRWRTRKVCTNQWRHHHRVRVCRTVRQRY